MIRNLLYPLPCLCCAYRWVWNFTINLCNMYWNWNKCLFILRPCAFLSSWLCFIIFYFSAFILKCILSLLSSLSAFYFPISHLSRFLSEVLESFKENSSGSNPKEIEVSKLIHPISWANVTKLSIYLETDAVVQTLPGTKSLIENILDLIKI